MADFMETEEELADFTLAEVMEMTTLFKGLKEKTISQEFCKELATKFSCSPYRTGKSFIKWEQVQTWFLDKKKPKAAKSPDDNVESVVPRPRRGRKSKAAKSPVDNIESVVHRPRQGRKPTAATSPVDNIESDVPRSQRGRKPKSEKTCSSLVLYKKYNTCGYTRVPDCAYDMPQRPRVSAAEMAKELSGLAFEALSAKDLAWYDVAAFLNFRVLYRGELEVRVRFAGFGNEEDEWVNVKRGVRERSVPLQPSECDRLNVGDPVMCFREDEYLAVYGDAMIVDIQKSLHDITRCTCIFVVRYDLDNAEEKVTLDKICCRPTLQQ